MATSKTESDKAIRDLTTIISKYEQPSDHSPLVLRELRAVRFKFLEEYHQITTASKKTKASTGNSADRKI